MRTNATITVARRGEAIDETSGLRTVASQSAVLDEARCFYGPGQGSRSVFNNGIREYVKAMDAVLIPGCSDITLSPGDQATVTPDDPCTPVLFTIDSALYAAGIGEGHWKCSIERIQTP